MTRETKVGLAVAGSFLSLVTVVVAARISQPELAERAHNSTAVADTSGKSNKGGSERVAPGKNSSSPKEQGKGLTTSSPPALMPPPAVPSAVKPPDVIPASGLASPSPQVAQAGQVQAVAPPPNLPTDLSFNQAVTEGTSRQTNAKTEAEKLAENRKKAAAVSGNTDKNVLDSKNGTNTAVTDPANANNAQNEATDKAKKLLAQIQKDKQPGVAKAPDAKVPGIPVAAVAPPTVPVPEPPALAPALPNSDKTAPPPLPPDPALPSPMPPVPPPPSSNVKPMLADTASPGTAPGAIAPPNADKKTAGPGLSAAPPPALPMPPSPPLAPAPTPSAPSTPSVSPPSPVSIAKNTSPTEPSPASAANTTPIASTSGVSSVPPAPSSSGSPPAAVAPIPVRSKAPAGQPDVEVYDVKTDQVRAGESSLSDVSKREYSSDKYTNALLKYNRGQPDTDPGLQGDPPVVRPGTKVYLPPAYVLEKPEYAGSAAPASGSATPIQVGTPTPLSSAPGNPATVNAPPPGTRMVAGGPDGNGNYRVREGGEPIFEIARNVYGNGDRWADIYRLNPGLNPSFPIPAGTVLKLPPASGR